MRTRIRPPGLAVTRGEIVLVQGAHVAELRLHELLGKPRHSIYAASVSTHRDQTVGEVKILDAQHEPFDRSELRTLKWTRHQPQGTLKLHETSPDFGAVGPTG
ncbi:hypothetical protein [Pelomicrobium sp.]|uniref:hypothetical protein n=1 Tax=Pelomicrobium sp. TaxID=2815319 RepID=UPI002FDCB644